MELKIPRDTNGEFEPRIVKKHERRLNDSVEDMIISMYAKGMSTRDIDRHMKNIYGAEVSAEMKPLRFDYEFKVDYEPKHASIVITGHVLDIEKEEGEKSLDFENRIIKNLNEVIKI